MLEIIDKNDNYAVCIKPVGISSEHDMPKLLSDEIGGEVFCIHRLDNVVGGVMIFARNKKSAASLSKQIADRSFIKEYLAVVEGCPENDEGTFTDLLFKDSRNNKSFVVKRMRKGVKEASLHYSVIGKSENLSLVKIRLVTGRTHQIRVQFASRKMPLVGDKRYGSKTESKQIGLWSHSITFADTENEKEITFTKLPDGYPFDIFV